MSLTNSSTPHTPTPVTDLDSLLSHIYARYVLPEDDFRLRQQVCQEVLWDLHQKMTQVDAYYKMHYAGSPSDNIRIVTLDEFGVNVEMGLPVSFEVDPTHQENSDVVISRVQPGLVKLRIGTEVHLSSTDENKVVRNWMDKKRYLLRSEFTNWFKTVVKLALTTFEKDVNHQPLYQADGIDYTINTREMGPEMILIIENDDTNFKLKVHVVPALNVPESRSPPGYKKRRGKAGIYDGDWMLIAKSVETQIPHDQTRAWQVARPEQERAILHEVGNPAVTQAFRLVKKLRDSLDLKLISSCYIKNLLLHGMVQLPKIKKIKKKRRQIFWETQNTAFFFEYIVRKLFIALLERRIDDFWIKRHNLLARIDDRTLSEYASRLWPFLELLENRDEYKKVAGYLLSPEELQRYNDTVSYTN